MSALLGTVLRGLRARALLSVGSVVLIALAVGSALLAPVFQSAVTTSYLVTRLAEAPNPLTGLTWRLTPDGVRADDPAAAVDAAAAAAADAEGPFGPPTTTLESDRFPALTGEAMFLALDDACAHLDVTGACPDAPREVLVLVGDAEERGVEVGEAVRVGGRDVTVVGTYTVPEAEEDFWFDPRRFVSAPLQVNDATGETVPYRPAPFVTAADTFDELEPGTWTVRVDRRLDARPDLTLAELETARATAAAASEGERTVEGGRLAAESINDVGTILDETRAQQATARDSISPAVLSLVLVALALLFRLLLAAADLRLPELALASLRGLSHRRMWRLGLSEPLALLLLATPVGVALGFGLAWLLVRWWLVPGLPLPVPWTAWAAAGLVLLGSLAVAATAVGQVLRVPLADQLAGVRRPAATGRLGLVLQLTIVAAAVAILLSKLTAAAPGDPDATDMVLPVLLAVVAGLAATRLVAAAASWWTRARRHTRSLSGFVASRAISRRREGTLVIAPVTAAIAISVFGVGVYDSAAQWRASAAATLAPADVLWAAEMPIDSAVRLTHEVDPEGDYLMAAGAMPTLGPTYAVVDTPRLERVARWSPQWTPGLSPEQVSERLAPRTRIPTLTGSSVSLTVDQRLDGTEELVVRLRLENGGPSHYAYLGPFGPGTSTQTGEVPFCADGCGLEGITLGGPAALPITMAGTVRLSGLTADGEPVDAWEGAGWGTAPQDTSDGAARSVGATTDGLQVALDTRGRSSLVRLTAGDLPRQLPVLRGATARTTPDESASAGGSEIAFEVDPVLTGASVPLLGPDGLMIDQQMLTSDRTLYEQGTQVYVLARSDTPAAMVRELRERGLSVDSTFTDVRRALDRSAYALALRLYAVVAVLVLVMALAGLLVSTAVQLPARRRDAASLRVVGVPRRSILSSVLRELAAVLGGTALAGLAAGTLAQYVVLRTVTLGTVEDVSTPALTAAVGWGRLLLLTLLAAAVLGAVALASASLTVRGARGSTLRENAR